MDPVTGYSYGVVQRIPWCPNTNCKKCSEIPFIPKGMRCIACPLCGPKGQDCPLYQCRSCVGQHQILDSNGCAVCKPCSTTPPAPSSSCVEPACGHCGKLHSTILSNGTRSCSECRARTNPEVYSCPALQCLSLQCNYGYIWPVTEDCCIGCAKCQPFASSECKTIICDTQQKCPEGSQYAEQYDSNGCQLCPTCRRGCPVFKCAQPECDACTQTYTPVSDNGCNMCPRCGIKPNLPALPLCNYVRIEDRHCEKSFAYVSTDSQGCCRISANQCQGSTTCPNVYCKPLSCDSGMSLVDQFDANGCRICPVCV